MSEQTMTRVILFAENDDKTLSISDIWQCDCPVAEAQRFFRDWHVGEASRYVMLAGYRLADGSEFFPWDGAASPVKGSRLIEAGRLSRIQHSTRL